MSNAMSNAGTPAPGARRPRFRPSDLRNTATPEVTQQATSAIDQAVSTAALSTSRLLSHMLTYFNFQVPTTDEDTLAVALYAGGDNVFMYNPEFVTSLATNDDVLFAVYHEMLHRLWRHLRDEVILTRRRDPLWELVEEAHVNHVALCRLDRSWNPTMPMPRRAMPRRSVTNDDGTTTLKPVGIDPREVYAKYAEALTADGQTPVSYNVFVATEESIYSELKRMPKGEQDEAQKQAAGAGAMCSQTEHSPAPGSEGPGSEGTDQGSPSAAGGRTAEDEALGEILSAAIQSTVSEAINGSESARAEILALGNASEGLGDRASQMWGKYGLGALRGTTEKTRKVAWWSKWLVNTLTSILTPGTKLIFPKKRTGMMLAMGMLPAPARRGKTRRSRVAVFLDTSGSVPASVIEIVSRLVGQIPNVIVDWFMFDGVVMRLVPGEAVTGGGGTSFHNCVDVVEGRTTVDGELVEGGYDAVLMLTDGIAPHVIPAEPDKWIWLITPGNDLWPERYGMPCHLLDLEEMADAA